MRSLLVVSGYNTQTKSLPDVSSCKNSQNHYPRSGICWDAPSSENRNFPILGSILSHISVLDLTDLRLTNYCMFLSTFWRTLQHHISEDVWREWRGEAVQCNWTVLFCHFSLVRSAIAFLIILSYWFSTLYKYIDLTEVNIKAWGV